MTPDAGPLAKFLAGRGRDAAGRTLDEVLAMDDARLEAVHDFIQWLFPLATRSAAVPGAPVLTTQEIAAIRADPIAQANLKRAAARMRAFYAATSFWLRPHDHNHLRITRIITSLALLAGAEEAAAFHRAVTEQVAATGAPVSAKSRAFWDEAAGLTAR